ncbi:biotin transporter BioY [Desulfitobacterium sp.]|uniref:biotin transporter BioY n=1 Tax=Desulfitobacterium sp. TaxID=49981 RepID=UPI002C02622C|nr:biotin transporter BioY [Desulfitobacterium sp.]HVJ49699.1 biotin transporter BioY [Desulfitobacterium sp.]
MMVFACLFTALIVIGGYISFPIPLSPVPIVLADFFTMLAGLFLGASWGGASVGLFLFLGALGLPVFAGGKAGLVVLFGPTGGFLFGYLIGALVIGLISGKGKSSFIKDLAALIVGNIILYGIGVPWLKLALKLSWEKALALGLLPFIPGMIIKIIVALALIKTLRPLLKSMITNPSQSRGD